LPAWPDLRLSNDSIVAVRAGGPYFTALFGSIRQTLLFMGSAGIYVLGGLPLLGNSWAIFEFCAFIRHRPASGSVSSGSRCSTWWHALMSVANPAAGTTADRRWRAVRIQRARPSLPACLVLMFDCW
jgi:hypothetical protein